MIKLKITHNKEVFTANTSKISVEAEGLKYFDSDMEAYMVRTWDKIDSYTIEGSVTEDQKAFAIAYQRGYSDTNPQHKHRPNTTGSL